MESMQTTGPVHGLLFLLGVLMQAACGTLGVPAGNGASASTHDRPFYALWITRWDTRSEQDIVDAVARAHDLGVTDIFWQVRGSFDAFYPSDLEPWGEFLLDREGQPPAHDPLAVALREAHARGLRLHAWINALPLWRGTTPPRDRRHAFHTHPAWRLHDASGRPEPLHEGYVMANPVLEDVHEHIARVCADLATRYAIDGLHLDYIRYGKPVGKTPLRYPRDARTISQFERAMGLHDLGTPEGERAYQRWIADRITSLVRRIRASVKGVRSDIEVSAAVWRHPSIAREVYLQDAARWAREGLLDRVVPMIYTELETQLVGDWAAWREAVPDGGARLTIGLGVYKHVPGETAEQVALAEGSDGFSLFAYSSLFDSADPSQDGSEAARRMRQERRDALRDLIDRLRHAAQVPGDSPRNP